MRHPTGGADLAFPLRWDKTSPPVADTFALQLAEVDFALRGQGLQALAEARFVLDEMALDVSFELPSQVFELRAALGPIAAPTCP